MMKRCFLYLLTLLLFGCTRTVYVPKPVEHRVEAVVTQYDTVIMTEIEHERVFVVTPDTVAYAQTTFAEATAEVANGNLTLDLRNKADAEIPVKTKYILKYVHDSVPYPVEVYIPQIVEKTPPLMVGFSLIGVIAILFVLIKRILNKWAKFSPF